MAAPSSLSYPLFEVLGIALKYKGFPHIDHTGRRTYSDMKSSFSVPVVAEKLIQALEAKVADLIALSHELNRENRQLKLRTAELQRERKELLERQRKASEAVDNTLQRLRNIEGGS